MLDLVRKHADSWIIKSILWLIVFAFTGTIFYSWGMGGASASRGGVVATVNGNSIMHSEYDKTFNNLLNFYRDQFRNQFSEELLKKLDLKTQAIDALIQKHLLIQKAEKQNIQVSDAELIDRIRSFPIFQKDNRFDETIYRNYLNQKRLNTLEFEESQREGLVIEKIENLIKSNTKVSESEASEAFLQEKEKIKLDYLVFPEDHFKDSSPVTDQEIEEFYKKHKAQFEVPEQIRVEYVKLEPKTFEGEIEPREEDIQIYYETKIADFHVQKQYKARHILIKLAPSEDAAEKTAEEKQKAMDEAAKSNAEEILKKIREGADFAEMAKKHSEDLNSGKNGGSLGEFLAGTMVKEFETALDKLQVGEISEPVLSPYGYHLIRLDGKSEERIKPLSEVKEEVIQKLKEVKSRQRVRRFIRRLRKSAENDANLARAAIEHKFETRTTGLISREKHELSEIGSVPEFFNQAFTLEDNRLSDPIHTFETSFLLKVVERNLAYIPELADVRSKVREATAKEKNRVFTQNKFNELKSRVTADKDLVKIAEEEKLDVRHTPYFSMGDSIPGIGNVKAIKQDAFRLAKGEATGASFRGKNYLIVLEDREAAGQPDEEELKAVSTRLKNEKAATVFNDWLENLKENADIMIDRSLL